MTVWPEPQASLVVLAFGLVVGSFLNVCIHRLPLGQSIVLPGSHCPGCNAAIAWYHNVPLLSWFALRGACASCGGRISWRYPAVEAASGAIAVALWLRFGPTAAFPIATGFFLAMLVLFFTDWDHQLLPDAVTLTGFATGMAIAWINPFLARPGWAGVWTALSGAAVGSGLLWAVGAIYTKLRGVEAMGMGDVKMMAMVGAFSGIEGVLFTIFAASLVGAIVGIALVPLRGRTLQDKLPFGCFLAPAAAVALLHARTLAQAYLRLVLPREL